uniref:sorting nexin-29-like n=1 Tax=Styela clava TaxID=7725 RepID=UPI00193A679E|nr:sorting nexin-29-like [Styela clava]
MSTFVHKATLLNRLLDATRECQTRYSTKKEIMTETNSCVSCVCRQFEDVLSHGIKQRPIVSGIATIQIVTGLQLVDQDVVFWHCVQKHLSKHEVERFNSLYHISTDIGRGRAWLRSSLNEHSLERVLQMLLSDPLGLKSYYSQDAFLLDEEKASLLPQIAGGLKSVMFSIKIDDNALNSFPQSFGNNLGHARADSGGGGGFTLPSLSQVSNLLGHEVAMEEFPQAAIQTVGSLPAKLDEGNKKRKKKAKTKIITFGHNGTSLSERSASVWSADGRGSSRRSHSYSHETSNSSIESQLDIRSNINSDHLQNDASGYTMQTIEPASNKNTTEASFTNRMTDIPKQNEELHIHATNKKATAVLMTLDFEPEEDIYKLTLEENIDESKPSSSSIILQNDPRPGKDMNLVFNEANNIINPSLAESYSEKKIADKLDSSFQLRFESGSDISSLNESAETDAKSIVSTSSSNQFDVNYSDTGSLNSGAEIMFTPLNDTDSIASSGSFPTTLMHRNFPLSRYTHSPKNNSSSSSMFDDDKTSDGKNADLQKALVVLLQRKDELVEENKAIKEMLRAEQQHNADLREENEKLKLQVEDLEHAAKSDSQKQLRENEVLRNQLKKYVGAVHALQHGKASGVSQEGIPGIGDAEDVSSSPNQDESNEAKIYEQKLIDVTEMHGELMEFTESIHTRFLSALSLIHKMHDELVALRGPMPTDDVIKAIEADKPRDNMAAVPVMARALVNVWVPSAFMQGSGPESHHVYQVYICVGEDEWNVYRRYSDFHSLHNMLCKSYPEIQNFGFPPKKGIGNRNSKFVEERRRAFQKYLRLVMHNVFQNNPELKASPTKATLLHILPFFCDAGDQCRVIVGKHKK